jgi:hypothetical protein
MAPDAVRMSLGVTVKVFHSLAWELAPVPHVFALLRWGERRDIHMMIMQHLSIFQRTSVVPPD